VLACLAKLAHRVVECGGGTQCRTDGHSPPPQTANGAGPSDPDTNDRPHAEVTLSLAHEYPIKWGEDGAVRASAPRFSSELKVLAVS
jgi:hypothetical protein